MADQHDSAQRPRPFAPPVPPFRGPGAAARPAPIPPSQPNGSRPPAPFVARRAAKPEHEPETPSPAASQAAPPTVAIAAALPTEHEPPPAAPTSHSATDAHLYGHDPFRPRTPIHVEARVETMSSATSATEAPLEDAAAALAGLPYFDDTGGEHQPSVQSASTQVSGKVHRVEFDPAAVLESIAGRIRSGVLALPDLDPRASDEATLAAILAALLRDSRR